MPQENGVINRFSSMPPFHAILLAIALLFISCLGPGWGFKAEPPFFYFTPPLSPTVLILHVNCVWNLCLCNGLQAKMVENPNHNESVWKVSTVHLLLRYYLWNVNSNTVRRWIYKEREPLWIMDPATLDRCPRACRIGPLHRYIQKLIYSFL